MKGESDRALDPSEVAVAALRCLGSDPERLGRFLALTGLDLASLRSASRDPGFTEALLDYLMGDEDLLFAVADESGRRPEAIAAACRRDFPVDDSAA